MAANAIRDVDLEAFARSRLLIRPSAWEAGVIFRLDDAVLGVWAAEHSTAGKPENRATTRGDIKALFKGLRERKGGG